MKRENMSRILQKRNNIGSPQAGAVRAGMHQAAEHEFRRSRMTVSAPEPESAEEALDLPEVLDEMIPEEEDAMPAVAEISADDETFEMAADDADPEGKETQEDTLSVDYSGERVPAIAPVTGGVDCLPHELVYDRGDGKVRVIPDPLGILSEKGLYPFFPEIKNPSANVHA